MTYSLFTTTGFVQNIATITGWDDVVKFVSSHNVAGPLKDFIDAGETEEVGKVMQEIDEIIPIATDQSIRKTLQGLREGLTKVKGVAVISE